MEVFKELHHLPDPVPCGDHFKEFESVYGTETSEEHRPSLKNTTKIKGHGMPFSPTTQTAKNAGIVLQCEECLKWRVVYSKRKLNPATRVKVMREVERLLYTCGSVFQEIDEYESSCLKDVFVRENLTCTEKIAVAKNTCFYDVERVSSDIKNGN